MMKRLWILSFLMLVSVGQARAQQDALPEVEYRFGWATVKGHLQDYQPEMTDTMILFFFPYATTLYPYHFGDTLSSPVTPSGDFSFRLPVAHISLVALEMDVPFPWENPKSLGTPRGYIYVGPDTETEVFVNSREISYRQKYRKAGGESMFYVTKGPLHQLANELNQHIFWLRFDFEQKYFNEWVSTHEEAEKQNTIYSMLPTRQLEVRMAELDTMKVDEQWSPALKELVGLYWGLKTALHVNTFLPFRLRDEKRDSLKSEEEILAWAREREAWQRDAVVAEVKTYERLLNNPKLIYCPEMTGVYLNRHVCTLLPDFIAYEKTAWKLREQIAQSFRTFNPDELTEPLALLPPAYKEWALAWYEYLSKQEKKRRSTRGIKPTKPVSVQ